MNSEIKKMNDRWNARKRGEDRVWIGTAEVIRERWVKPDWRECFIWGTSLGFIVVVAVFLMGVL